MNGTPLHASYASVAGNTQLENGSSLYSLSQPERRRAHKTDSITAAAPTPYEDEEKTPPNCLAIPVVLSQTKVIKGSIGGADQQRFWIWIEIVWLSFWTCKLVAHFLPAIFKLFAGVISPGVRKYAPLLRAVEQPLSFVFWMIVDQVTFPVLVRAIPSREKNQPGWIPKVKSVLLAVLVCTCIIFAERILIQLISNSYHQKQFKGKIKESKRNIYLLSLLYDASTARFSEYCNAFAKLDYIIQSSFDFSHRKANLGPSQSSSTRPMRLAKEVSRFGDKLTAAFGDFNPAHSVVLRALEKPQSAEALAERIWKSFVVEGNDTLYRKDFVNAMGSGRQAEAAELFLALDKNENADLSLDEMVFAVADWGRQHNSMNSSMHDAGQAIEALDSLLFTIVLIVCSLVLVAFLSPSFVGTLATSATALLSLSFVFAVTCQEVLGSCIFLFIKHPYDTGDRIDVATNQLTVEQISLLYTIFKRVESGKIVQVPNIILNSLWVENITRSRAMREQLSIFAAFDTPFEDINTLEQEIAKFLCDPANGRDFYPDLALEVVGVAEMDKLELRIAVKHKSNFSNEALRASRRSKFMRALIAALRSIPIHGPGGGEAILGSADRLTWSVSIPPAEAVTAREAFFTNKDTLRLYPSHTIQKQ